MRNIWSEWKAKALTANIRMFKIFGSPKDHWVFTPSYSGMYVLLLFAGVSTLGYHLSISERCFVFKDVLSRHIESTNLIWRHTAVVKLATTKAVGQILGLWSCAVNTQIQEFDGENMLWRNTTLKTYKHAHIYILYRVVLLRMYH